MCYTWHDSVIRWRKLAHSRRAAQWPSALSFSIGAHHVKPQFAPWRARIACSRRGLPLVGAEVAPGIDTGAGRLAIGVEF
jgi:hypothetical protein